MFCSPSSFTTSDPFSPKRAGVPSTFLCKCSRGQCSVLNDHSQNPIFDTLICVLVPAVVRGWSQISSSDFWNTFESDTSNKQTIHFSYPDISSCKQEKMLSPKIICNSYPEHTRSKEYLNEILLRPRQEWIPPVKLHFLIYLKTSGLEVEDKMEQFCFW